MSGRVSGFRYTLSRLDSRELTGGNPTPPPIPPRTDGPERRLRVPSDAPGVVGWWVNPQAPGIDACGQAIKLMELTLATNS